VHQDLRADNLLYSVEAGESSVVVVDFQALTAGVGATDLAYLIGGSVADPAERSAIERGLLEVYRSRLSSYGVDSTVDGLWNDYRHGSLWGVIMTVLSSIGSARTERGEVMFAAMANRHAQHALELEALDVLA
jgi:thiamine kinase-like enzyme